MPLYYPTATKGEARWGFEWSWETMWWWWAVGSGGAKLWVWSEQYPKGAIILQAGFSLDLLPPAVSKENGLPAAQLGSTHSYCCFAQSTGADLPPPQQGAAESCWHGMPARSTVQPPPILRYQANGRQMRSWPLANNKNHLAELVCGVWLSCCSLTS